MKPITLEICAFSFDACLNAEKGGANRIELCDNPVEGGTTPSYGFIKRVREKVSLKLYPIIRPRGGHYNYSVDEFEIMLSDIRMCRDLMCDGVSIGIQKPDGTIDVERMKRFKEAAGPLGVTCNRAFDLTPDPFKALEDLVSAGCERVLTSGQASFAHEAAELLERLVKASAGRIIVMPGSGVRPENIERLAKITGAVEYHSAARMNLENPMTFQNKRVLDLGGVISSDQLLMKELRRIAEASL